MRGAASTPQGGSILSTHAPGRPRSPQEPLRCPLCSEGINNSIGAHIREAHGEEALRAAVLTAKEQGLADAEIGARYGVSFNTLQEILTEAYGANVTVLKRPKRPKRWEPPAFREETTTVWSYRQRGDWATHNGRYRGNWSPYIPRNVILKYSEPGDVVLDYFVGAGTTAVEAKLLGRRCIARDINPGAVGITRENLNFSPPRQLFGAGALPVYEPEISVGDATDLSDIPDSGVDLICAHPPYAGIIKYSTGIPGDLSDLTLEDFLVQMEEVAQESRRVLKPGGKCAILIGDGREAKHVVPIGFHTMRVFLDAGFVLTELVIKRQHKCKSTGFWYKRSIEHNFLLLAHEHLPIFERPLGNTLPQELPSAAGTVPRRVSTDEIDDVSAVDGREVETTSVWILPQRSIDEEIRRNLVTRFATPASQFLELALEGPEAVHDAGATTNPSVIHMRLPRGLTDEEQAARYRGAVKRAAEEAADLLPTGGFLAVDAQDTRLKDSVVPMALAVYEDLLPEARFTIKEIIVVVPEGVPEHPETDGDALQIAHRYLLVYRRNGNRHRIGET